MFMRTPTGATPCARPLIDGQMRRNNTVEHREIASDRIDPRGVLDFAAGVRRAGSENQNQLGWHYGTHLSISGDNMKTTNVIAQSPLITPPIAINSLPIIAAPPPPTSGGRQPTDRSYADPRTAVGASAYAARCFSSPPGDSPSPSHDSRRFRSIYQTCSYGRFNICHRIIAVVCLRLWILRRVCWRGR